MTTVAWSPKGDQVVSGEWSNKANVWNATTKKLVTTLGSDTLFVAIDYPTVGLGKEIISRASGSLFPWAGVPRDHGRQLRANIELFGKMLFTVP